jgi:hypothetical protein
MREVFADIGAVKPSIASEGTYANGKALLVYGRGSVLNGRYLTWSTDVFGRRTETLGSRFAITTIASNRVIFSTDVIFNQHSGKYIVGYIERGAMAGCEIKNVVVSGTSRVRNPVTFGSCDFDQGGHHTSVAYNPQGDGTYVWWRQNINRDKAVFIHDANGNLTTFPTFSTEGLNGAVPTAPVTASVNASVPYFILARNFLNLFGVKSDKTFTIADRLDLPLGPVAVRSLTFGTVGLLTEGFQNGNHHLSLIVSDQR